MPTDDEDDDKGAGTGGDDGGAGGSEGKNPKTVPYERFQRAVADKNDWKRKFEALGGQAAEQFRIQLEEERNGRKADREQFAAEGTLRDAGFGDAEGRELAMWAYNRLPKENRPTLDNVLKGWKADPTKAPKAVQSYFQQPEPAKGGAGGSDDGGGGAGKATEKGAGGGGGLPGARPGTSVGGAGGAAKGDPVSAEKLQQLRQEAVRTGDWSAWNAALGREANKK